MKWISYENSLRGTAWQAPTPDGVARALAEAQAGRLRYCHDTLAWFAWDSALWRRDRTGSVLALIRDIARERGTDPGGKSTAAAGGTAFVAGAERFARGEAALAVTDDTWDADPFLLGTPAGTIALRTGTLAPADPRDGITRATAVAATGEGPEADCPLWRRFLAETFEGDEALIGFLQRFCGYALTGSTVEHRLVYGWGTGGNGKSVFLNTILGVLGDYAQPAALATLVSVDHARYGVDLAALRGARLVGVAESDGGRSWTERRVKVLTGGDAVPLPVGRASAAAPAPPVFRPTCKLLIMGNQPPRLSVVDEAMRRRLCVVPFRHRPARPDRDLEARLRAEWPAILRWMIDGCLLWQSDGLCPPLTVAETTADALDGQDPIGQFLAERCDASPEDDTRSATAAALYAAWRVWADASGEPAGSQRAFASALACRGYRRDRTEHARLYRGLGLRAESDKPDA